MLTLGVSTMADGSEGMPNGSYLLFRNSGLNCFFLEGEVGEIIEKDIILPTSSNSRLLELSGVECRKGEEFGVFKRVFYFYSNCF